MDMQPMGPPDSGSQMGEMHARLLGLVNQVIAIHTGHMKGDRSPESEKMEMDLLRQVRAELTSMSGGARPPWAGMGGMGGMR